ncbi:ubiquitin carboxyl-terminal hydrolase 1-like isoform X1 [Macrosteles quadrilineatus]|uniref:ubiquitin carboxyl-terminal hydrolase 1-like isoform X1 n=2 Tax=Macrosteles quadrilineatus TaxID=74068 RepID=UPI0023E1911A|nr:ubiquitin carboxyl-terminal hydrolase 1-like isoform X1 [Macrosteles quadrilineatus]
MTILGVDPSSPPLKRIRLCQEVADTHYKYCYPMATPIDAAGVMLNGYGGLVDTHKTHSPDDSSLNTEGVSPVATLCNLGNTCFLNSVLYTLRFAPSFLHNLHHLVADLTELSGRYSHLKNKSSSLGRGIGGGSKNWSNKDLSTMGQEDKTAVATLRLHELYEALHHTELKDHIEPYQPEIFLTALREVNPIFEGNQQHDAHELLVCLVDTMRETCRQLCELHERQRCIIPQPPPPTCPLPPAKSSFSSNVRKSLKLGKTKSNGVLDKKNPLNDGPLICEQPLTQNDEEGPRVANNFISEDFEGVMLLYTTCLECERTSQLSESFIDISVPITAPSGPCVTSEEVSSLYHSAVITEEYLIDSEKYWCEDCGRYNEARRNISYDTLPRLLILHLKRFSSSYGSCVQKVNEYMPTPIELSCFCNKCKDLEERLKPHRGYQLYGIIMHLGSTLASGHYVSYVCGRDTVMDSANCTRDKRKTASLSGGAGKPASNTEKHGTQKTLFRFFSKSSKPTYPSPLENRGPYFSPCRSADCCGAKLDTNEPVWLECDDDTVRTISKKHLGELLGPKNSKNSALTPYLLFYSRIQSA